MDKYKIRIWRSGRIRRSLNDEPHCTTGPAIEDLGYKAWYVNGIYLREKLRLKLPTLEPVHDKR